jgi:chorismate mutase
VSGSIDVPTFNHPSQPQSRVQSISEPRAGPALTESTLDSVLKTDDTDAVRNLINQLDDELIRLWRLRATASVCIGSLRVAAGGTRIVLNREGQIISKYAVNLGSLGQDLALLVLRAGRGALLSPASSKLTDLDRRPGS